MLRRARLCHSKSSVCLSVTLQYCTWVVVILINFKMIRWTIDLALHGLPHATSAISGGTNRQLWNTAKIRLEWGLGQFVRRKPAISETRQDRTTVIILLFNTKAVLSQWKPREAAVRIRFCFDAYRNLTSASRGFSCDSTAFLFSFSLICCDRNAENGPLHFAVSCSKNDLNVCNASDGRACVSCWPLAV